MSVFGKLRSLLRPAAPANRAFIDQMRAGTMPAGPEREKEEREAREAQLKYLAPRKENEKLWTSPE